MSDIKKICVTDIQWDTDGENPEELGLPKDVDIEINEDTKHLLDDVDGYTDGVTDYLSDTYGYCIFGCNIDCEV